LPREELDLLLHRGLPREVWNYFTGASSAVSFDFSFLEYQPVAEWFVYLVCFVVIKSDR
jgi:hypothetical protein